MYSKKTKSQKVKRLLFLSLSLTQIDESLSLDPEQRCNAEAWLAEVADWPNYVLAVRRLVDELIRELRRSQS
jgi:hypothetical protein